MGTGKEERTVASFLFDRVIDGINVWDRARNSWAWLTFKAFVRRPERPKTRPSPVAAKRVEPQAPSNLVQIRRRPS